MPQCPICENSIERWRADPRHDQTSPIVRVLDVVGADPVRHLCPSCGADDRERHVWLYLTATRLLEATRGQPALHIGAEPRLREKLSRLDIAWTFAPEEEFEATLPAFAVGRFQLIVCNRVLPRARDLAATVQNLNRILADRGWLVAQSPYSPMLKRTLSLNATLTAKAAHLFFGDDRCLRLFGADAAEAFLAAGLHGGLYPHQQLLPDVDAATSGCNPREPFFLFSRQPCPTFRS